MIKAIFINFLLFFSYSLEGKIYDCFLFFNELEVLKIRFEELYDHVDYFVLIESSETFQGNPKPLYFQENAHLFEKYKDKIIHIMITKRYLTKNPWTREAYQRNQILKGLKRCNRDDLILISDCDEIPFKETIGKLANAIYEEGHKLALVSHRMFRYHLNRFDRVHWAGTVASTYRIVREKGPNYLRFNNLDYHTIRGGWHFTFMGGYDRYVQKHEAWSHTETNTPEQKSISFFEADVFLRPVVPLDRSFPQYILDHEEELMEKGYLSWE